MVTGLLTVVKNKMLNQGITTAVFTSTNQTPHYSYSINYQTKQFLMYRDQNKWSPGRMVGFPTGPTVFSDTKSNNNQLYICENLQLNVFLQSLPYSILNDLPCTFMFQTCLDLFQVISASRDQGRIFVPPNTSL